MTSIDNMPRRILLTYWHFLPFALLALWLAYAGTPFENTLNLSAQGKIDFWSVWFYRFRDAGLLSPHPFWGGTLAVFFWIIKFTGIRIFWVALLLAQAILLRNNRVRSKLLFIAIALAATLLGDSALLWSAVLFFFLKSLQRHWQAILTAAAMAFFLLLALSLANPVYYVHRQKVLGGKSFKDPLKLHDKKQKIQIRESCVAALNVDDLKGINSLEILDAASFTGFENIIPVELKVVEENYRLLSLKDEHGKLVFSDNARAFASAELAYAQKKMPALLTAKTLCLIANFDTMPAAETAPFSRARKILELRKKAGLETRIIQLP